MRVSSAVDSLNSTVDDSLRFMASLLFLFDHSQTMADYSIAALKWNDRSAARSETNLRKRRRKRRLISFYFLRRRLKRPMMRRMRPTIAVRRIPSRRRPPTPRFMSMVFSTKPIIKTINPFCQSFILLF